MVADEFADLYRRDLTRLMQQIQAFPDDATPWQTAPGISNPAGNLVLHLEGNLREFVGRQLGGIAYTRQRDLEFSTTGLGAAELAARVESLRDTIPRVILAIPLSSFDEPYPEDVLGVRITKRQFLIHLLGHLNYHLGQIDYARRLLTGAGAIKLAGLRSG